MTPPAWHRKAADGARHASPPHCAAPPATLAWCAHKRHSSGRNIVQHRVKPDEAFDQKSQPFQKRH
eukprot:6321091-Amphidinium_carterae.1